MVGATTIILALAFFVGLALAFGLIANFAFKRSSPARRAAIASVALGILLSAPAFVALISSGAPLASIAAVSVGVFILAALSFRSPCS